MIYFDATRNRWIVEIDRRIKSPGGTVRRVRRRKMLAKGTTEDQARLVGHKLEADEVTHATAVEGAAGWDSYVATLLQQKTSWLHITLAKCRNRACAGGYVCSLTPGLLALAMLRSKGRCEVTGLKFTTEVPTERRKRPFFHSIDRIEPGGGYTPDNIRIVCFAVNMAMSNWGEKIFAELATGYVINRYSAFNLLRQAV